MQEWNDNSVVTMVTNAESVFPTSNVTRYSHKEKKRVSVQQPRVIKMYNQNMGGVDRADQNISLYCVSIRGKKWYFPLIAQCIDMAEQNAWQIHKLNGGRMDHLSFRRSIAQSFLETYKKTTK
ncbi:hypothetical protein ABEB36_009272 [Hypothenemus hampei]|uniref:PiggyBac transposable element-derived protein domain-containing protein n=1 Tax=Hypothenemus hampei TaxID=57062 RepID=A0ABD1EFU9_HYPHA